MEKKKNYALRKGRHLPERFLTKLTFCKRPRVDMSYTACHSNQTSM